MTALTDAVELLEKYDGLDLNRRVNDAAASLLSEIRTRALVSIAESLSTIAGATFTDQQRSQITDALVGLEIQGRNR